MTLFEIYYRINVTKTVLEVIFREKSRVKLTSGCVQNRLPVCANQLPARLKMGYFSRQNTMSSVAGSFMRSLWKYGTSPANSPTSPHK